MPINQFVFKQRKHNVSVYWHYTGAESDLFNGLGSVTPISDIGETPTPLTPPPAPRPDPPEEKTSKKASKKRPDSAGSGKKKGGKGGKKGKCKDCELL